LPKKNKATGIDNINCNIIIDVYDIIKAPLYFIFKSSLKKGIFPDLLKIAKVTPIFKVGDPSDVGNYRPISVLPVFSKLLERIMYNRIYEFLNKNNLLFSNQFGFQKNTSTEHAILKLVDDITTAFVKRDFTIGVFIDLSKAFDTVNHEILVKKLEYYGITGINQKWFESYLKNRKQCVVFDNDSLTEHLDITCGVPQGSILGPLLFLIYVNDLHKSCPKLSPVMFADDTNLFYSDKNILNLFSVMNSELENVSKWFKANKLSLNIKKTKFSLFHQANRSHNIPEELPVLILDRIIIKRDKVTKFLGVFIDENLSWKYQIDYLSTKVAKSIGILYKSRHYLNKPLLKQLYFSFIHSYLSYANIVWASTHKSKLLPLYRRQKHAIRVISFKDRFTHAKPLLVKNNILSLYEINIFQILFFMYKCKRKIAPKIFHYLFTFKPENKYVSRYTGILFEPFHTRKFSDFTISFRGPHLWNKIIASEKNLCDHESFSLFKYEVKKYLLDIKDILDFF